MSFLDDMKNKAKNAWGNLETEAKKFMNDKFKNGACAACALVAAADGKIDDEEIEAFLEFVLSSSLKVFPVDQIDTTFRDFAGKLNGPKRVVEQAALLQMIMSLKGKPEAMLVVGVAIEVAKMGGISDKEKAVLIKICTAAGVDPSLFDELK